MAIAIPIALPIAQPIAIGIDGSGIGGGVAATWILQTEEGAPIFTEEGATIQLESP